ncbi:MAG: tRNA (adenosine(37)-N6)-threonylcarbamoyltransferase complex ATPase subunit type 1 TsaE [Ignavibacteriaceae bacterium]|nr:tRNA (adenosine(37)-N6)-threonylcarbamoyltransferase complex ATPase subunit type 1 TsaE [Ignavibacteriaceae bacterium]
MLLPFAKIVRTEEDTIKIADEFSSKIKPGDVIVLNGNLGAGKTFFVKYVVKNFEIDNVNSPTFAIVNEYNGKHKIYHFDFYRINNSSELFDIGFDDYLNDDNAITFIEWAELFPEIIPRERFQVDIIMNNNLSRAFSITKINPIKIHIS